MISNQLNIPYIKIKNVTVCKTKGSDGKTGASCVFPFYYKGNKYYGCIKEPNRFQSKRGRWCATTSNYAEDDSKNWAYCGEDCPWFYF